MPSRGFVPSEHNSGHLGRADKTWNDIYVNHIHSSDFDEVKDQLDTLQDRFDENGAGGGNGTYVKPPTQRGAITYTGEAQDVSFTGYNPLLMTVSGTTMATNAGEYEATFTLLDPINFRWTTDTTEPKKVKWTIDKAAGNVVLTPSSMEIAIGVTKTISVARLGDGEITAVSSNPLLASVSVSGETITVRALALGSVTVTVYATNASNHLAASAVCGITVVERNVLPIPTAAGELTYNGASQSPTFNGVNLTIMSLSGDTNGTNAGTYNAVFTLTNTAEYQWEDGTDTPKTVPWVIGRAEISTMPSQANNLNYNGSTQAPTWNGYDTTKMTIGGTLTGTATGEYTATFTPTANYKWSDGSTTAKEVKWKINKQACTISLDKTSISLTPTNTSTIIVTRNSTGAITALSSDTNIATVSVSSTVVTVTAVALGTATITINVAEDANYGLTSAEVSVAVVNIPATLNECTWAMIDEISRDGTIQTYFDEGDYKEVQVNGTVGQKNFSETYRAFVLGFNHNKELEGDKRTDFFIGKNTSGIDIALCDWDGTVNNGSSSANGTHYFNMEHWGYDNYGGWAASDMRYDVLGSTNQQPTGYGSRYTSASANVGVDAAANSNTSPKANTLMAALPADLRNVMKRVTKYTDNIAGGTHVESNVTGIKDYLWLLSEFEVFGQRTYANPYEQNKQKQYEYFKNGNSKIAYKQDSVSSAVLWWLRSPYSGSYRYFCDVGQDGAAGSGGSSSRYGVRAAFAV